MKRPALICVHRGIYRETGSKTFFHSLRLPGKKFPTKRKLAATTLTAAIAEVETLNTRRREATLGVGLDPYTENLTVEKLAELWLATDCQARDGQPRRDASLTAETARLQKLLPFWRGKTVTDIIAYEDCPEYHQWRVRRRKEKTFRLGRSVDAELVTLSNLLAWCARNPRKTGVRFNPLAERPHYDNPKLVRHCTAVMPMSDEAFHQVAAHLLASDRSRGLGWQTLLEGLTGCRTSEILACRLDATAPGKPGYMNHAALHIHRCKDGIEPWALLESAPGHSPLRDCLQAFLHWHEARYRHTPIFIPNHLNAKLPTDRCSLTKALRRACAELELPLITSHGLRAYHVAALRSMGIADAEIAARLGHRSTHQIEHTYGTVKPGWLGSWQMDFLPEDFAPAWSDWTPKLAYQKLISPTAAEGNSKKPNAPVHRHLSQQKRQ